MDESIGWMLTERGKDPDIVRIQWDLDDQIATVKYLSGNTRRMSRKYLELFGRPVNERD